MGKAKMPDYFSLASGELELEQARDRIAQLEALNRQLEAQLEPAVEGDGDDVAIIPIHLIDRNPEQVRRYFDPHEQEKLTQSMRSYGFWGRLLVRRRGDRFELIAGERRLRSAIAAELKEVKVDILDIGEDEALALSLIENLNRVDLNPVEETEGMLRLLTARLGGDLEATKALLYKMKNHMERSTAVTPTETKHFAVIQQTFATVGRINWQTFMSSRIRLLNLPHEILDALQQGKIEYSKAIEISRVKLAAARRALLQESITEDLSVAEIRERVRGLRPDRPPSLRDELKSVIKVFPKDFTDRRKAKRAEKLITELRQLLSEG